MYDLIYGSVKKSWSEERTLIKTFNKREIELSDEVNVDLAERLSGLVLLQIESKGEAWYVFPLDQKRYFLGRPEDALQIVKKLSLQIESDELLDYLYFEKAMPDSILGRFVWTDENPDDLYYFNPKLKKAELVGDASEVLDFLTERGVGVSNQDIRQIEVGLIE